MTKTQILTAGLLCCFLHLLLASTPVQIENDLSTFPFTFYVSIYNELI